MPRSLHRAYTNCLVRSASTIWHIAYSLSTFPIDILPPSHARTHTPRPSLQVQSYMADGQMTPDRAAALESLREKMGLPKEAADKIVKGFTNQRLIAGLQVRGGPGGVGLGLG